MKPVPLLFCMALLAPRLAQAAIEVEVSCWTHHLRSNPDKMLKFALRTYRDTELNREVGAFVQYAGSKDMIPLVFRKFVSTDEEPDGEPGNYELTRVEIVDGKIGGEYVFALVGAGIRRGRMVTYRKSKSARPLSFYHSTNLDGTCSFKPEWPVHAGRPDALDSVLVPVNELDSLRSGE